MPKRSRGVHRLAVVIAVIATIIFYLYVTLRDGEPIRNPGWDGFVVLSVFWLIVYGGTRLVVFAWGWVQDGFRADRG